jgi:hypothetical protein
MRMQRFETTGYDEPPDLLARLQNHGFNIVAEESLIILDLQELSPDLLAPNPKASQSHRCALRLIAGNRERQTIDPLSGGGLRRRDYQTQVFYSLVRSDDTAGV